MSTPLVLHANGDIIDVSHVNDIIPYIESGLYRVNTLALEIGGTEVITSSRQLQNITGVSLVSSGVSVPSSTPASVGDIYIDTVKLKIYIATGTSSSADWKKVMST